MALAALLSACGGADLTLPENAQPSHIDIVTGNAQAGIAGTALALPLVVKITDGIGRPVGGQPVEFTVQAGGGEMNPVSLETDADGRASAAWTLGAAAGTQEVEARAVGPGAPDNLALTFTATAVAGSGSLLTAVSGDDQSVSVNSVLPESLVVRASDGAGNPVGGVTVVWTVQGGGSISPETVVTGDDGQAAALRVLGGTAGQQIAQATADGLAGSPLTFVHTALASSPSALNRVSGDNQSAPAGFEVAEDLVVQLTDADGNGVGGRPVTWVVATGGGVVSPVNSTTDPNGLARTRWTLGNSAGANTLSAVFSGLSPVSFAATASADVPSKLAVVSGDNQSAVVGQPLPDPLAVKVTDANDNPVPNVSVSWTASGGGSVSSGTSATDANGLAVITRILGATPGDYATTAAVSGITGSPIAFRSTATAGPPAKLLIVAQPGPAATSGVALSPQPVVQVQDAQGNNVGPAGRPIAAALASGPAGAALIGNLTSGTDAGGKATFTGLGISGPAGTYVLRFSSGALPQVASGAVTVTAGAVSASRSTVTATPDQIAAGGATSTITVTARDAAGNLIVGASVTLAATGAGNALAPPSGTTNSSGVVTSSFSSTSVGPHTITAKINGVDITDNSVVTVKAGAVSPSQSSVNAAPDQIAAGASSTITATARDAGGNPVQGAAVQLATDAGGTIGQPGATNASGVATGTFSSTTLGPHTITGTVNGIAVTDVATVTVTVGAAAKLVIATQPDGTAPNGVQLSPQPVVQVQDAQGNNAGPAGRSITASIASGPAGAVLGGDVTRETDGNGRAAFADLSITGPVGNYTIRFNSGTLSAATSNAISITPGPVSASRSTVSATPDQIAAGGAPSTITVTARDAGGNLIQGAEVVLAATGSNTTLNPQNGTTSASGVVTSAFSSTSVGQHTITARINGVNISDNSVVTVTAGAVSASQSTVSASPEVITAGGAPSTVTITARDAGGNPIQGATVALSATGAGNTVAAPAPTNASGVTTTTFTSTQAGSHAINATITGVSINDNATVAVQPAAAATLTFTQQPTTTPAGQTITPAVVVAVQDQFGNPTAGTVTMSLIVPLFASGTLSGTLSVAATAGSATFSDLSVDSPALFAYRLTATLGGISTNSLGFLVTP